MKNKSKFTQKICTYIAAIFALLICNVTVLAQHGTDNMLNENSFSGAQANRDLFALLASITTMSADFAQTIVPQHSNHNGNIQASTAQPTTGKMVLSRPGKFRWEVEQPTQQLIIADGRYVWVYDVDLEQVTKQLLKAQSNGNPAQLLSGSVDKLYHTFNVIRLPSKDANTNNHYDYFELRPKIKNGMYSWIRLLFINEKLQQMAMEDSLGQRNEFDFSNVKTNVEISPSLFIFTVPNGVDVINN